MWTEETDILTTTKAEIGEKSKNHMSLNVAKIQFTVTATQKKKKVFTFMKLESENSDFYSVEMTQKDEQKSTGVEIRMTYPHPGWC